MALIDWMRLLALAALWGCSYLFIEIALESASPITIVFCRIVIAAACLVGYCAVIGVRTPLTGALVVSFFVMGILNNVVPFNLIAWGQTHITGGVASIFNATTPLFTVIVAHLWPGGERATPARIAGVVIGFIGVLVLIGLGNFADISRELPGQTAMLLAAFSYALSALYGRRLAKVPPMVAAAGMLTASSLMMLPIAFMFHTPFEPMPTIGGFAAIAGLAVLSSAIAYIIFFRLIGTIGSNVMLVTFIMPVIALATGAVILGEVIELRHLGGLLLIFCGLALVDGRVLRLLPFGQESKPESTKFDSKGGKV